MTTTKPRTTEALEDIRLRVEQSGKEPPQRALSLEIIRALKKMHPSIKLMQFTEVMTKRQVALSLPLTTIREDGSKFAVKQEIAETSKHIRRAAFCFPASGSHW